MIEINRNIVIGVLIGFFVIPLFIEGEAYGMFRAIFGIALATMMGILFPNINRKLEERNRK